MLRFLARAEEKEKKGEEKKKLAIISAEHQK